MIKYFESVHKLTEFMNQDGGREKGYVSIHIQSAISYYEDSERAEYGLDIDVLKEKSEEHNWCVAKKVK